MEYFKYNLNGDIWTIYIIIDQDYIIEDEDTAALTRFTEKELYFRESEINIKNVLHELFHVWAGYCYLESTTNISVSDMEEIFACLFSDKCERSIEISKDILNKLETLKEQQNNEQPELP